MDSPSTLCTQRVSGLWSSFPPELEENSLLHIQENMPEEREGSLSKLHREDKSTAEALMEKQEVPYRDSDKNKWWEERVTESELDRSDALADKTTNRFDENENITDKKRSGSASCVPDEDKKLEGGVKVNDRSSSDSKGQDKHQTAAGIVSVKDEEPSNGRSSNLLSSVFGYIPSTQKLKESIREQIKQVADAGAERVAANWSYDLGYFTGRLSEAYKDAEKRLQGTRDIIQNVRAGDMKVVLSQYVTKMSKELPLIHRMQLKPEPEPCVLAENKVSSVDVSLDRTLSLPQNSDMSVIPGVSGWPEGSVSSLRNTCPEVFHQNLVQMPPALSQLRSLSSQKILEKLESLAPQIKLNKLLSIFWIQTANREQPIPQPGCLLLSEQDITVLSSKFSSSDTLAVFHHFDLMEIKKVQISLAGQHVRLIGCTEDAVLAVFTHSRDLTQELCKALLKVLSPEDLPEGTEDHPLLSGDLMALSLDWSSSVPDIVLDGGLHITSRFKRVLADLLYIVHGNMDGPGKPSLANICPLLYTSVKLMNSTRLHQSAIFQFLLTDTHIALLREDGVFHPVPRGTSLVPSQPQFRGLELRKRSEIRCLLVRRSDDWLVVEITFTTNKPERKVESRRGSAEVPSVSHRRSQCHSWNLSFGCTAEAMILINHLST